MLFKNIPKNIIDKDIKFFRITQISYFFGCLFHFISIVGFFHHKIFIMAFFNAFISVPAFIIAFFIKS